MSNNEKERVIKSVNKGEIAILKIQLECGNRNYIISKPTTEVRYDVIIDCGAKLYRTQVKYLNRKHGKNSLELRIEDKRHRKSGKCYTKDEIDIMLIYLPKYDAILVLKPAHFHNKKTIRFNLVNPTAKTYYKNFLW